MTDKKRIVIVEDEIFLGRMLKERLTDMGYQADWVVTSGEQAIAIVADIQPHLTLMDIKLSGALDGIEVAERIRNEWGSPVIYLTSHVDESYIERAKRTQPLGYLVKPIHSPALKTAIEMAFAKIDVDQRLAESEKRYRALVETQVELLCRYNSDGKLTYVNDSYCKYYNSDRESLIGTSKGLPEIRLKIRNLPLLRISSGSEENTVSYATQDIGLDGKKRHQQWTEVSLHDGRGMLEEVQAVGRDVTSQTMSQQDALSRIEVRFRAVFDSATDSVFILDDKLRYTHVNEAGQNLLGLPESGIVGCAPEDVFGPEIGFKLSSIFSRVLKGAPAQYEQTRTVSGITMTFSESVTPLKNADGEVVGLCCICRNITERSRLDHCEVDKRHTFESVAMRQTMSLAEAASSSDGTICLLGESGAGKDHLAKWIHENSRRSSGPFVPINCAVLPETLAESELFGHERGAFTGAAVQKRGLLELAEGGTILLNEIGELSINLQSKLLSFIDNKSFLRVGGSKSITVDSRLIVATHRRLDQEVSAGRFMEPLFHRINVFPITIPPLRHRLEDIPSLCYEIIQKLCCDIPLNVPPAMDVLHYSRLCDYHWPGNVRELRNVLERSMMLWKGGEFQLQLPVNVDARADWAVSVNGLENLPLNDITSRIVAIVCAEMVNRCNGNKTMAAKRLGISRDALYRHLKKNQDGCITHTDSHWLS